MQVGKSLSIMNLFFEADLVVQFIMLLLFFMSIFSWSIIISKILNFSKVRKSCDIFEKEFWSGQFLSQLYTKFKNDESNPLSKCFSAAMSEWNRVDFSEMSLDRKKVILERINNLIILLSNKESYKLSKGLNYLATIASAAPFIGLFGTVWGIMSSFQAISMAKNTSLSVVAPGIAEALLATAIGLFAAIPAAIFYNLLNSQVGEIESRMEDFSSELELTLQKELEKRL